MPQDSSTSHEVLGVVVVGVGVTVVAVATHVIVAGQGRRSAVEGQRETNSRS